MSDRSDGKGLLPLHTFGKIVAVMWIWILLTAIGIVISNNVSRGPPLDPLHQYYGNVASAFLIWTGASVWLIARKKTRFSLRILFVIVTGYAVIGAIAANVISQYHEMYR